MLSDYNLKEGLYLKKLSRLLNMTMAFHARAYMACALDDAHREKPDKLSSLLIMGNAIKRE